MNEQCWILLGKYLQDEAFWKVALCRHVSGHPSSVEADWLWTLSQEAEAGNVLGFAHTHPIGVGTTPSGRDVRTMRAWCSSLGKPLLCPIAEGDDLRNPAGYVFEDDESEGIPTTSFEVVQIELETDTAEDTGG